MDIPYTTNRQPAISPEGVKPTEQQKHPVGTLFKENNLQGLNSTGTITERKITVINYKEFLEKIYEAILDIKQRIEKFPVVKKLYEPSIDELPPKIQSIIEKQSSTDRMQPTKNAETEKELIDLLINSNEPIVRDLVNRQKKESLFDSNLFAKTIKPVFIESQKNLLKDLFENKDKFNSLEAERATNRLLNEEKDSSDVSKVFDYIVDLENKNPGKRFLKSYMYENFHNIINKQASIEEQIDRFQLIKKTFAKVQLDIGEKERREYMEGLDMKLFITLFETYEYEKVLTTLFESNHLEYSEKNAKFYSKLLSYLAANRNYFEQIGKREEFQKCMNKVITALNQSRNPE